MQMEKFKPTYYMHAQVMRKSVFLKSLNFGKITHSTTSCCACQVKSLLMQTFYITVLH